MFITDRIKHIQFSPIRNKTEPVAQQYEIWIIPCNTNNVLRWLFVGGLCCTIEMIMSSLRGTILCRAHMRTLNHTIDIIVIYVHTTSSSTSQLLPSASQAAEPQHEHSHVREHIHDHRHHNRDSDHLLELGAKSPNVRMDEIALCVSNSLRCNLSLHVRLVVRVRI